MVSTSGYELILGSSTDPQFGPVLVFGLGGQLVEVLRDNAHALPPLTTTLARRMMENTRILQALKGVRGRKPVDLEKLEELLVRFSELVVENPRIADIEINPLLASEQGFIALDARVILHPATMRDAELPRPAIRPYPSQYISNWQTHDGTSFTLRPIRPDDEPLMVDFHHQLSENSVYMRFFLPLKLDFRVSHERLFTKCFIDYEREIGLVAEYTDEEGARRIAGIARLIRKHSDNSAEVAFLIADKFQNRGLGTHMLDTTIQIARKEGIATLEGATLSDNFNMKDMFIKAGFPFCAAGRRRGHGGTAVEISARNLRQSCISGYNPAGLAVGTCEQNHIHGLTSGAHLGSAKEAGYDPLTDPELVAAISARRPCHRVRHFYFCFLPFLPAPFLRQFAFAGLAAIFALFAFATGVLTIAAAVRGAGQGGSSWLMLADGIAVAIGGLIILLPLA